MVVLRVLTDMQKFGDIGTNAIFFLLSNINHDEEFNIFFNFIGTDIR